ncbi:MAG: ATP phosphoribosyltransferase [Bacteroidaceae bacterium]|nr:ATP phosphoribosyltransferase [Bacteroidaceae bacterium]
MIRIAIQSKGRLYEDTIALLSEAGIKIPGSKRTLLVSSTNFPLEVLYLRDDDIPQSVASGVADLGIVGRNELEERGERVDVVRPLGFSHCRLSLAIPKSEKYNGLQWFQGRRIATSYPTILHRFMQEHGIEADIHVITGSVEISPGIGLSDAIFDIVSSGSTLVSNNLCEVEVVMQSEALLIANPTLGNDKRQVLSELLFRIEAVKNAEDKKYVLMNVPTERLNDVIRVLPGMRSPTVMPLATPGWNSVHTVIDEHSFWQIISQLKELGAEGILVIPVEKMIL